MHHSVNQSPSLPNQLLPLLVCTLLPACVQQATAAHPMDDGSRAHPEAAASAGTSTAHSAPAGSPFPVSQPYLLACLPPPLRFAEPVVISMPVTTPVVVGPPTPGATPETPENSSESPVSPSAARTQDTSATPAAGGTNATSATPESVIVPTPPAAGGISVLPDPTPREVRPEDVLMYFQYPVAAPANITPPPSSATYRQQ